MKNILFIASLFTVSLALGCKPAPEKLAGHSNEPAVQPLGKAQIAANVVTAQERSFTFGQKTEYVMAMREQWVDLNRGIDEHSAKIDRSSEAVQAEAKPQLAELREKAAQFDKQLTEIASATLPTWDVMKADVDTAYASLKDRLAKSNKAVSDKVAP